MGIFLNKILSFLLYTYNAHRYQFHNMNMPETTWTIIAVKAWLFASMVTVFAYTWVNSEAFTVLWILMLIDMVTGISKQYRIDPQEVISHRWWLGLIKKIYTLVGILSVWMAIRWGWFDPATFIALVIPWFIAAELYSVIQNIYIFSTGEQVTEFNATKFVFQALLKLIRWRIESETEQVIKTYSPEKKWNSPEQQNYIRNDHL